MDENEIIQELEILDLNSIYFTNNWRDVEIDDIEDFFKIIESIEQKLPEDCEEGKRYIFSIRQRFADSIKNLLSEYKKYKIVLSSEYELYMEYNISLYCSWSSK